MKKFPEIFQSLLVATKFRLINKNLNEFVHDYYKWLQFIWGFPGGSDGKLSACNAGDLGSIPGLGRSPGGGYGNPFQYSCLENSTFPSDIDSSRWLLTLCILMCWTRTFGRKDQDGMEKPLQIWLIWQTSSLTLYMCIHAESLSHVWLWYHAHLLCPWDFSGKNTEVGCHFLLQGISPTGIKIS